jgi:aminoglycoside/choline kinase family phosphotransferase
LENLTEILIQEFEKFSKRKVSNIELISDGVSGKIIYRIFTADDTYIGIYNSNIRENLAFIGFSRVFKLLDLNVPIVYYVSENNLIYFVSDFGDVTLHHLLMTSEDEHLKIKLKKLALEYLVKFQILGRDSIDYNLCYQTDSFNLEQILYDENMFKKYYLLYNKYRIDENILDKAFEIINRNILSDNEYYFMYRDFQPRNILVKDDDLYFIDYQSGRKGPLLYDLTSFLYSGSIELSEDERDYLKNYYKLILRNNGIEIINFENKYSYITLIRLLQMLGSYAFAYESRKDEKYKKKMESGVDKIKSIIGKFKNDDIKKFISSLEYHS